MRHRTGSAGFALAVALLALVLISALLAGVFFAALQEVRLGRGALAAQRALAASEAGLADALAGWEPARMDGLAPWQSASFGGSLSAGTASFSGTVTRLNATLFLVRATGASGEARHVVGHIVRLVPPPLDFRAALSAARRVGVGASSLLNGDDSIPAGWSCPASLPAPGLRIVDPGLVADADCPIGACVRGAPALAGDPSLGQALEQLDVLLAWARASASSARTYAPGASPPALLGPVGTALACDSSSQANWGEPTDPPLVAGCASFFPVVLAEGDLRISGGRGQGVLWVQGNLDVEGGFEFRGVVLVRGTLTVRGLGGRFLGAVAASDVDLRPEGLGGRAEFRYSSCAASAALLKNALPVPLAARGWFEEF